MSPNVKRKLGQARPRILIADDSILSQQVAGRLAEQLGFDYDLVGTGREAVQAARCGGYAAILMDCQMPEMDGFEAARAIRALSQPSSKTPIIAVSANGSSILTRRCRDAGMNEAIVKPVRLESLQQLLARWTGAGRRSFGPVIDARVLQNLSTAGYAVTGGSVRLVAELIDLFLEVAPPIVNDLEGAIRAQDARDVERFAHKLKGTCRNLGAEALAGTCESLETLAAQRSFRGCRELGAELRPRLEAVTVELLTKYRGRA